jgi:hypothetical protein
MPEETVFRVPSFVNMTSVEVDQELNATQPLNSSVNKFEAFTDTPDYHLKNKPFLSYDDGSSFQP